MNGLRRFTQFLIFSKSTKSTKRIGRKRTPKAWGAKVAQKILNDSAFKEYSSLRSRGLLSPRLIRFVDGLNSGSAPLDWACLSAMGMAQKDGTFFRIISTYRDYEGQVREYQRGRLVSLQKTTNDKGYKYVRATDVIVQPSAVSTYAWAGTSYHNYGLAVDIVFRSLGEVPRGVDVSRGGWSFDSLADFYEQIGLIKWARDCGLEWGGYWTKPYDCAHFQDSNYKLPESPWNYDCVFTALSGAENPVTLDSSGGDVGGSPSKSAFLVFLGVVLAVLLGVFKK